MIIRTYTGLKSNLVFFFFLAGIVLVVSVFFLGMARAVEFLLPLLTGLSYLLIFIFVVGFLPASFFKGLRPSLARHSVSMSHALGAVTWMVSFFFVIKTFGLGWIFFALLFQFLAPIAVVGAIFKGAWAMAGHLALWISFTYAMRFYSQWLSSSGHPPRQKGDVIDVDVVEVKSGDKI